MFRSSLQLHGSHRCRTVCLLVLTASLTLGCGSGEVIVPVTGQVLLDGKPLTFGGVAFHPPAGQPARGRIDEKGNFTLTTKELDDGAVVGTHRVRVSCYQRQSPEKMAKNSETPLGRLLIPERYTSIDTSGIEIQVAEGMEPVVLELTSKE